jgi:hypothetical protein
MISEKTTILSAIISTIGILGVGLFANWDKVFSPSNGSGVTKPSQPDTKPSEPTCKAKRFDVHDQPISTSGIDAKPVNGDSEIDSDDWTRVWISYKVAVLPKTVVMTLIWEAQELNSNKSLGDTRIRTEKQIELYRVSTECKKSVITGRSNLNISDSQTREFEGKQHNLTSFTRSVGNLRNIRVRFDGPGSSDHRLQQLEGVFSGFSVSISETP